LRGGLDKVPISRWLRAEFYSPDKIPSILRNRWVIACGIYPTQFVDAVFYMHAVNPTPVNTVLCENLAKVFIHEVTIGNAL